MEITTLPRKNKKLAVKKKNDIEYKKVKCFAMGLVAVHFNQFFSQLGKGMVWLIRVELMILKFGFFCYDDRHKGAICLQPHGD